MTTILNAFRSSNDMNATTTLANDLGFNKIVFSEATWFNSRRLVSISPGNWSASICVEMVGQFGEPCALLTKNGSLILSKGHFENFKSYLDSQDKS